MIAIDKFRTAMANATLNYGGPILADGQIHRFKAEGDRSLNSWYVLHDGQPIGGAFGCWKRCFSETWSEHDSKSMSAPDRQRVNERWKEAKAESERKKQDRHTEARAVADIILNESKVTQEHAYLTSKAAGVYGDIREHKGRLVLPLRDAAGVLHSVQFIGADSSKRFLTGGRVAGCFFTICGREDGPLIICEGVATGLSIHEATGLAVAAALNCGNLLAVSQALRARWPDRQIIIAADDDRNTAGNPGMTKAREAAMAIGAKLATPRFTDMTTKPTDFNDLQQLDGLDAVKAQIEGATTPKETDDETLARLAKLTDMEYARARKGEKNRLGINVSLLDLKVAKLRPETAATDDQLQGQELKLPDVVPWEEPVDGASVLDAVSKIILRYVVLPPAAADAIALWLAHAHCFECFLHTPRLNIYSPEKGCGKTTLRDVIETMVPRPVATESLTVAVLFRIVDAHRPTLMADEVDSWIHDNEELRGMLNAGHRKGARALRCEGDDHTVRGFNVFCPTVLCGIGSLPGTLHDRSIRIRMERAAPGEVKVRFDSRHTEAETEICRKLARWTGDNLGQLAASDPTLPKGAFNRLADNWRPLLALAELAGGDWPRRAFAAFEKLTDAADVDTQGLGTMLLTDIQSAFNEAKQETMFSSDLVSALSAMKERPWDEANRGKPITQNWLAKHLKSFNISSRSTRIGNDTAKGYPLVAFEEAFVRYLPESGVSKRYNVTTLDTIDENSLFNPSQQGAVCRFEKPLPTNGTSTCNGVTFPNPLPQPEKDKPAPPKPEHWYEKESPDPNDELSPWAVVLPKEGVPPRDNTPTHNVDLDPNIPSSFRPTKKGFNA